LAEGEEKEEEPTKLEIIRLHSYALFFVVHITAVFVAFVCYIRWHQY